MNTQSINHYLPALARLLMAAIFLMSGLSKVADPTATIAYIRAVGAPLPLAGFAAAVAVELAGSVLLILGYKARAGAAVLAGFSIVAAALFHSNFADLNQTIHFMKNVALAGGLMHILAFGAGGLSLDAFFSGKRENAPQTA